MGSAGKSSKDSYQDIEHAVQAASSFQAAFKASRSVSIYKLKGV